MFEWENKLNEWNYNDELVPFFPDHILGELNEQDDQPPKEDKLKEKKKKKQAIPSGVHGGSSSSIPKEDVRSDML